jgi:hypothetical protein
MYVQRCASTEIDSYRQEAKIGKGDTVAVDSTTVPVPVYEINQSALPAVSDHYARLTYTDNTPSLFIQMTEL